MNKQINITVNNENLIVDLVNNSSTAALIQLIEENGSIEISMDDYGRMEKVGNLPKKLPKNDKHITAQPGDLILYMGSALVLYYEPNSWNFTKLGSVINKNQKELKQLLGKTSVNIHLEIR